MSTRSACTWLNNKHTLAGEVGVQMEFTRELATFKKLASKEALRRVQDLVQKNNGPALLAYGDMCMSGFWDMTGMQTILAMEYELAPEAPFGNPKSDPYLLVPRSPKEAIEWYLKAASVPATTDEAAFRLAVCQKFNLASLGPKNALVNNAQLVYRKSLMALMKKDRLYPQRVEAFLKKNGQSDPMKAKWDLERGQAAIFSPLPDKRPVVDHPLEEPFKKVADLTASRDLPMIIISAVVMGYACLILASTSYTLESHWWACFKVWIAFSLTPLVLFRLLVYIFGSRWHLPVCSCKSLREAYGHRLLLLPNGTSLKANPFETTPWLIRNLLYIKQCYLWAGFVFPLVWIIGGFNNTWPIASWQYSDRSLEQCMFAISMANLMACGITIGHQTRDPPVDIGKAIIAPLVTTNVHCNAVLEECKPLTIEELQAIERL